MEDPPHLFVVQADLVRLACDDVLVPTDARRTVTPGLLPLLPPCVVAGPEPAGTGPGGGTDPYGRGASTVGPRTGRVQAVGSNGDGPRAWLVDTAGDGDGDDAWIVGGVEEWLQAVAGSDGPPRRGRTRRLAALPLVGTGGGGASGRRGDLLRELLPRLEKAAVDLGLDVALALPNPSDHAAAQRVRLDLGLSWPLPRDLADAARRLAGLAASGELALFLGAGVSAAAGLPLWGELVELLARQADVPEQDLAGLAGLPPQDAASLVARRLGQPALRARVGEIFADRPHALAHALLAALPVREAVTTNYDTLYESAAAGAGRPVRVLPAERPGPGERWLLKLHGDVASPESVVLTREEFLEYDAGRSALAGVVEALLLTRHVLFVGLSLLDDNLVRIAHRVAQVRGEGAQPVGTALGLVSDPLRAELWSGDLDAVTMLDRGSTAVAARRLEVFLDLVGALAARPVGYLLDPAYRGLLTDSERDLAGRLEEVTRADAADAPAWAPVATLLRELGLPC